MNFKQSLCEQKKEHSYCSTQFNLPSRLADSIIAWSKEHIDDKHVYDNDEKDYGREDEIHVTALFGLHADTLPKVKEAVKDFKAFMVRLGKISKFSSQMYDVLKLEIYSPSLIKLNRLLRDECPYTSNFPNYVPHATLAYVKKDSCDHLLGNEQFLGKKFIAKELLFSDTRRIKTKIPLN